MKSVNERSRLIVIEGGDGTGKTTQTEKLCVALATGGREILHIREPGSTGLGERVRAMLLDLPAAGEAEISPLAETFLYMAARAQLFSEVLEPAPDAGRLVLLERFYYSTYAYQGAGLGMDRELILRMGEAAVGQVRPDIVLLFDMDPAESFCRLGAGRDRVESRDLGYHRRVREGFLELAGRNNDIFRVIDAVGTPEDVHERVLEALHDAL